LPEVKSKQMGCIEKRVHTKLKLGK